VRTIDETQELIGSIWVELLGLDAPPDPSARFFAEGGDSILCVRFIAIARTRGVELTIRDVLEDDEMESLAARARPTGERS
jgi:hypothetical protein